ncbi:hypothetical protein [Nocardia sp. NPDC057440]|uniref:hypothetical protein n=1 Tax=Nocardia sp. NPDC057440 TaxID=3346134 RepID=UPI00366BBD8F
MSGPIAAAPNAGQKRVALRASLGSGRIQPWPGAFNPLVAELIQEIGVEGGYVSGAVTSAAASRASTWPSNTRAYADAGPDLILTEALADIAEFAKFRAVVNVPLLADMTEFGTSELLSAGALEDLGYNAAMLERIAGQSAANALFDRRRSTPVCRSGSCSSEVGCTGRRSPGDLPEPHPNQASVWCNRRDRTERCGTAASARESE